MRPRHCHWQLVVNDNKLVDHVASVNRSAYCHLRQIRPTMQSLSRDTAKTLVQAFISSCLDYCNSVLYVLTDNYLTTAVCTKRCRQVNHTDWSLWTHITCSAVTEVAACPTPCRLQTSTLMFKSLHCCAPSYLSDACMSAPEASRRLRSSGAITCIIPWSRTCLGDRSFDVACPRLWNKLPASLQSSGSICQFRRQLKTFLFVKD